ncbi:hypothetical protein PISMIDRAFT_682457, partial [Pisolithus microcarpus 441]
HIDNSTPIMGMRTDKETPLFHADKLTPGRYGVLPVIPDFLIIPLLRVYYGAIKRCAYSLLLRT